MSSFELSFDYNYYRLSAYIYVFGRHITGVLLVLSLTTSHESIYFAIFIEMCNACIYTPTDDCATFTVTSLRDQQKNFNPCPNFIDPNPG